MNSFMNIYTTLHSHLPNVFLRPEVSSPTRTFHPRDMPTSAILPFTQAPQSLLTFAPRP